MIPAICRVKLIDIAAITATCLAAYGCTYNTTVNSNRTLEGMVCLPPEVNHKSVQVLALGRYGQPLLRLAADIDSDGFFMFKGLPPACDMVLLRIADRLTGTYLSPEFPVYCARSINVIDEALTVHPGAVPYVKKTLELRDISNAPVSQGVARVRFSDTWQQYTLVDGRLELTYRRPDTVAEVVVDGFLPVIMDLEAQAPFVVLERQ